MHGFFVTGTDTEVGKTRISVALVEGLITQGRRVAVMKPVASGCEATPQGLRNEDAVALLQAANVIMPYEQVNPYAFASAIAPHLAAEQAAVTIERDIILHAFRQLQHTADQIVVEGAGGWLVPLDAQTTLADIAIEMQLPVILVVAIKLGCINHALLTTDAINASGLTLAGWVANDFSEDVQAEGIIETLVKRIDAPLIGRVPRLTTQQSASAYLDLTRCKMPLL